MGSAISRQVGLGCMRKVAHTHAHIHKGLKNVKTYRVWWCTRLNPALGRQKQMDLCELQASLIYIENSRPAQAT